MTLKTNHDNYLTYSNLHIQSKSAFFKLADIFDLKVTLDQGEPNKFSFSGFVR